MECCTLEKGEETPMSVAEVAATCLHTEIVLHTVEQFGRKLTQGGSQQDAAALRAELHHTLENMGWQTGSRLAERLMHREPLSNVTTQDAAKFVATTLWRNVFNRKIDRLRGKESYFEMTDSNFKWLRSASFRIVTAHSMSASVTSIPTPAGDTAGTQPDEIAAGPKDFVAFSAGLVCGALDALGFPHVAVGTSIVSTNEVHFTLDFRTQ
jgi:hypothetical protein